jgi:hypothetical protein
MGQSWLIIERLENWKVDKTNGFSFFGLSSRHHKFASEIRKDDVLYCYVSSRISAFTDSRVVQDAQIKTTRRATYRDFYDQTFAFYFVTAPLLVLPREKWVPIKELISDLDLTRGRAAWSALFQTSIRKLSTHDAAVLKSRLEKAAQEK